MAFPSPFLIFTGSSSIEITCGLNSEKEKKIETARNYYLNRPYTKLSLIVESKSSVEKVKSKNKVNNFNFFPLEPECDFNNVL